MIFFIFGRLEKIWNTVAHVTFMILRNIWKFGNNWKLGIFERCAPVAKVGLMDKGWPTDSIPKINVASVTVLCMYPWTKGSSTTRNSPWPWNSSLALQPVEGQQVRSNKEGLIGTPNKAVNTRTDQVINELIIELFDCVIFTRSVTNPRPHIESTYHIFSNSLWKK